MKSQSTYTLNEMMQAAKIASTANGIKIEGPSFKVIELTSCPDKLLFACNRIEELERAVSHTIGFVESTGVCPETIRLLKEVMPGRNKQTEEKGYSELLKRSADTMIASKQAAINEIKEAGTPRYAKAVCIGEHKFTLEGGAVCPECVSEYDEECEVCDGVSDESGRSNLTVIVPWNTSKNIHNDMNKVLIDQLEREIEVLKNGQVSKL